MRILSLAILLFFGVLSFAQTSVVQISGTIKDEDSGKPLDGATIEVFQDGKPFETKTCASSGKIPLIDLPVNHSYTIYIKKSGYVTKMVTIDAHHAYPEDLYPIIGQQLESSLFKVVEGIDFSFLETTPMIEFKMDETGLIGYDKAALQAMKVKIEKLKTQMEIQKQENLKKEQEDAAKTANYNEYIKAGDAAMTSTKYDVAITQYEAALGVIPGDPIATQKLAEAKKKQAEKQKADGDQAAYSAKIEAAKIAYTAKKLEESLVLYKEALVLKPNDTYATSQILLIETEIKKQKDAADKFNALVAQGDAAMTTKLFDDAIAKYKEALVLKPGDVAVTAKLADAQKQKLAKEQADLASKENEAKYLKLIQEADAAFNTSSYDVAKTKYTEALVIKPGEAYPTGKLKEIEAALLKKQQDLDAANKKEADYKRIMGEGQALFTQKSWEAAKAKYTEALVLKNNDPAALAQIALINLELEKQAGETKKNAEYTAAMNEADALLAQKKYTEAKAKYNQALVIKPGEAIPKAKIVDIDLLLANQAKQEQLEKDYQAVMAEGNTFKDSKDYTSAIDRYNKALVLKPGDVTATAKIAEINKILEEQKKVAEQQKLYESYIAKAEASYNTKDYTTAKMNYQEAFKIKADPAITQKIKDIDALIAQTQNETQTQAKYDAAIKEADVFYKAGNLEQALTKYREAGVIKPNELLPKEKISELEQKIAAQKEQAAKDQQFKDYVAAGDAAQISKDYQKALASYQEAIKIKPDPTISQKITQLNTLISQQSQTQQVDAKYKAKVDEANAAFTAKNWELARQLYKDAQVIKPAETYPAAQIIEIEKQMKAETDAEVEVNYQKIITKADGLKTEERFDEAIVYYQNALKLKPSDPYPKAQIDAINKIKTDRANALSGQEKLNQEYAALIKTADEAFNAQNFTLALAKYKEALIKKPGEVHPTNRISEINTKLSTQNQDQQKEDQYNNYITQANTLFDSKSYLEAIKVYKQALTIKSNDAYATNRIEEATRLEQTKSVDEIEIQYQKVLTAAQKKFDAADYTGALDLYNRAKTMKPSDPLPQKKIDEINQLLNNKTTDAEYTKIIQQADVYFEKKDWANAKLYYEKALAIKSDSWPTNQIALINKTMQGESEVQINEQYLKIIAKADEYFNAKDYVKSLSYYERALGIKPSDQHAISRKDEIDRLLHPEKYVTASSDVKDYGDPVNTTEVEIQALLIDADKQRDFLVTQSVEEQRITAEDATTENSTSQTEENFETESHAAEISLDIEDQAWTAEVKRTEATLEVIEMEYQLDDVQRERAVTNENDVQIQNQIVINQQIENENRDEGNDLPREEYLADVERIKIEVATEETDNSNVQTEAVYEQKEYVNTIQEEHITNDPNNDVDRMNGEVYVEDMNILFINETNQNTWNQEDAVMQVKENTEVLVDEQISNNVGADIPREEGILNMDDQMLDRAEMDRNNSENQYDVIIDQKKYAENISLEIEENNSTNDIPRQKMEVVVENAEIGIEENLDQLAADQNAETNKANEEMDNFEIVLETDQIERDKVREDYEEEVVVIKDDIQDHANNLSQLNIDNSFATEDHTDGMTDTKTNFDIVADTKSTINADNTNDAVEDLIETNKTISDGNQAAVEATEDYVDELKQVDAVPDNETMKNELGQKYPEGVTEEIFAVNDENGLLSSYIVRRIVVVNGTGYVYEKVQTRYGGVTYTRDGQPIAEFQWTDETESATLTRN